MHEFTPLSFFKCTIEVYKTYECVYTIVNMRGWSMRLKLTKHNYCHITLCMHS